MFQAVRDGTIQPTTDDLFDPKDALAGAVFLISIDFI